VKLSARKIFVTMRLLSSPRTSLKIGRMDSTPAASTIQNFGKNEACGAVRTVLQFLQKSCEAYNQSFMDILSGHGHFDDGPIAPGIS